MLNPEQIVDTVKVNAGEKPIWLAYSGGLDSHVLVHLLAQQHAHFSQPIRLVHVDHNLHADSAQWALHCQQIARQLDLLLDVLQVEVTDIEQMGLEAAARFARYQAIASHIGSDAVLVTAQHQQDQAETVMLQLLRGAGSLGLSAMQTHANWQQMKLIRPLLQTQRIALEAYAQQQQLNWIEDPSNLNTEIRRNFLRHQVWPTLQQRWPALNQTLARSAAHLAEAQQLLDERAEDDLQMLFADTLQRRLNVPALLRLSPVRQRNVLRFFIRKLGLTLPSTAILQCLIDELCLAKADAMPQVHWVNVEARRYRENIYFLNTTHFVELKESHHITSLENLPLGQDKTLVWQAAVGEGLQQSVISAGLMLRYRQGGEKIQLSQNGPRLSLKNLFQQWAIPPWQRNTIPLLFAEGKLVAVVGYAISADAQVEAQQKGWLPTIMPAEHAFFD